MKSFNYYWRYLLQIFYSFLRKNCTKQKALSKKTLTLVFKYGKLIKVKNQKKIRQTQEGEQLKPLNISFSSSICLIEEVDLR